MRYGDLVGGVWSYLPKLPALRPITGLWLGASSEIAEADRFVVAPRGAAQQVYRAQVQRRIDPALLEQVGPEQYRLRAFPILPPERGTAKKSMDCQWHPGQPLHH